MRARSIPSLIGAVFMTAMLTGCYPYYGGSYYDGPVYGGVPYYGGGIYRYGNVYAPYPYHRHHRHAHSHRSHRDHPDRHSQAQLRFDRDGDAGRRDWRHGDGEFHRRQREQGRVDLLQRERLDRAERLRDGRRDSADGTRLLRQKREAQQRVGRVESNERAAAELRARRDRNLARSVRRATTAERDAQRRAAEVRQRLRAERQAERENLPLVPAPGGGAQLQR